MDCTRLNLTTTMDETIMVKGCLGLLPCGKRGKSSGKKSAAAAEKKGPKDRSAPVSASPVKAVKPSVAVLPSPRHNNNNIPRNKKIDELKGNTVNAHSKPSFHDAVKGQLQLGFHVDGQAILVQIFEAKNLKFRSPFCPGDSCYVAVELVSKTEENKRQTTRPVSEVNPIFNEEFVLRMKNRSNDSARLVISVYKTTNSTGCDEMIGCMSFGVSGLQEKCTSNMDVYYLLSRPLGMKKHLRTSQGKHLNLLANMSGVSSLSTLMSRQTNSLLVRTTGNNNHNNSNSNMSGISKPQPLQQRRFRNVSQFTVLTGSIIEETDCAGYSAATSESMWSYQMAVFNRNSFYPQRLNSTTKLSTPLRDNSANVNDSVRTTRESTSSHHQRQLRRIPSDLDSCSLSSISLCDLTSSPGQATFNKFRIIHGPEGANLGPQEYYGSDAEEDAASTGSSSGSSLKLSDFHYDESTIEINNTNNNSKSSGENKTSDYFEGSSSSSGNSASSLRFSDFVDTFSSDNCSSLGDKKPSRASLQSLTKEEELFLQLIHAEDKFVTLMHQGVLRFSRPLRHGILTAFEHQTLFQNVEKLLAISEFHLKKLADCWAANQHDLQTVGNIYQAQLQVLCEAYTNYFRGLSTADELLRELITKPTFVEFLRKELPGVPDIQLDSFLQAPQEHFQNLVCVFDDLVAMVKSQQRPSVLTKVQSELSLVLDQCMEGSDQLRYSAEFHEEQFFESYITSEFKKADDHRELDNCNINPDLVLIEEKIRFANNVKPFHLAVPGRYIVFSGELDFIVNWKWVKATVFLTNDALIVAKNEANGQLTVITEPISLRDVLTTEFNCKHPCEILLTAKSESRDTAWSHMRTATFRASTVGDKETWARLVKKCVAAIKNERKTSF